MAKKTSKQALRLETEGDKVMHSVNRYLVEWSDLFAMRLVETRSKQHRPVPVANLTIQPYLAFGHAVPQALLVEQGV